MNILLEVADAPPPWPMRVVVVVLGVFLVWFFRRHWFSIGRH